MRSQQEREKEREGKGLDEARKFTRSITERLKDTEKREKSRVNDAGVDETNAQGKLWVG